MKLSDEAKSRLKQLVTDATSEQTVGHRSDLFDRYMAEKYGDEVKGRSQFVSSDAADAVEAILPDVMDVFTASEQLLEFAPVGPEDEEAAKQETQAVSHIFWQKNPGYEILYTWIKEAMIQQNAYVWRGWVEKERVEIEEYEDLTPEELASVVSSLDGDYEFIEQSGFTVEGDQIALDGEDISVKIRCVKKEKRYVIEPFPQEDFFCTPRWSRLGFDGVPCVGRRHRDKRVEDWLEFGFSRESLEKLTDDVEDENKASRFHTNDLDENEANSDEIELCEAYVLIDANDDDRLELLQVWCSDDGTQILEWADGTEAVEEVGSIPITGLTPYIMPHRHVGRSVVEQVDDIQQVKTVLLRQILDNTYFTNYPRPVYDPDMAGPDTAQDIANPAPGAGIRIQGGPQAIFWHTPQPVANSILPLLETFDGLKETRVGATRYNQGLDAESLNKTATGIGMIMGASQKKHKLIARTIAETALKDLFMGIHRDLRSGPIKDLMIRMNGAWVPVDPRTWKHRADMTVNVGMGRGDRDEVRAGLTMLGQVQRELMASGSRMVDEQKIWNTVNKVAETFGIQNLEVYLGNPATLGPPPPAEPAPPDPILIAAQADAQKKIADAQRDAAKAQSDERQKVRDHEYRMMQLRLREIEVTNRIQDEQERLDLDKKKAIMADDFQRDKLEIETASGFHREAMKAVSEPPISYEQITQD